MDDDRLDELARARAEEEGAGVAAAAGGAPRHRGRPLYLVVRRYRADAAPAAIAELLRQAGEELVPLIARLPGFVAYYLLEAGEGTVVSVGLFDDPTGSEASTRRAADWVKQTPAAGVLGPPEVLAGEVAAYRIREAWFSRRRR